jgi:DnaA family protein
VSESSKQLPLDFKQNNEQTFAEFIVGSNTSLLKSLQTFSQSKETILYIWGEIGSGKSHILNAFTNYCAENNKSAVVLAPNDLAQRENISLIEMFDYICIDNIEQLAADSLLEESLFHWINEIKQYKKKIILACQISNKSSEWQLPDLKSRLQSGRTHKIKALDRHKVIDVFIKQAQQKGIKIDIRVSQFLQNNCPMNMRYLSELLSKLDQITLIEKKQVTIPLIKKIIQT